MQSYVFFYRAVTYRFFFFCLIFESDNCTIFTIHPPPPTSVLRQLCLTLTHTTNLRHFLLKYFADDNFKFNKNGRKVFKRKENPVEKGAHSPFPTVFSKDLYRRHVQSRPCLGKGKKYEQFSSILFC